MESNNRLTNLPQGFTSRPATMADLKPVIELLNTCSIEQVGVPTWEQSEFEVDWQGPSFDLARDTRVVLAPDNEIAAYCDVWDQSPHVRIYSMGKVRPDLKGKGIGGSLARWIEQRAQQSIPLAPPDARVVVMQSVVATDDVSQSLLQARDFRLVRYFHDMQIEMDAPPPSPVLPAGMVIRPYQRETELPAVLEAVRESFRDHWGHVEAPFEDDLKEWTHWVGNDPEHDPDLWLLAMDGDQVAGIALCRGRSHEDPNMGWINVLGVRRLWRRQGLGLALLHASFGALYRLGRRKAGLGVDAASLTGATRLYEKAGMRTARQYASFQKELRPGVDLSTQSMTE